MKKLLYLFAFCVLLTSCGQKPFEGKISYEAEFKTGLGESFGLVDAVLGTATNSTIDLYVKGGKVMMVTEPNNRAFGSFQGQFSKLIWNLDSQEAYVINDKDKTYMVESLLETDIEGFDFRDMKAQLDSSKAHLKTAVKEEVIAGRNCKLYEVEGSVLYGKVGLNSELLEQMKPTVQKIEGLQEYDLSGLGFPLYYETKLFGKLGMEIRATKIEEKTLDEGVFSLDGYRKIDRIEFYKENFDGVDWKAFGLDDEVDQLKKNLDSAGTEIMKDVNAFADTLMKDLNTDKLMDQFNNFLKGGDDEGE